MSVSFEVRVFSTATMAMLSQKKCTRDLVHWLPHKAAAMTIGTSSFAVILIASHDGGHDA